MRRTARRPRPPATNAELHAWNFGVRSREAAGGVASSLQNYQELASLPPTPDEEAAFLKLGLDKFHHWAVRGWWSLSNRGDNV